MRKIGVIPAHLAASRTHMYSQRERFGPENSSSPRVRVVNAAEFHVLDGIPQFRGWNVPFRRQLSHKCTLLNYA